MSIVRNYYSAFIYARDGRYVEPDVAPGLVLSRISAVMGRRTIQLEGIVDERIIGLLPQLKTRNGPGKILHKGLRKYDVVLTTYEVMKSNLKNCMIARNALCGLTWDRIVLDEAHRIRNKKTKLHLAALTLEGRFRWCLTGTPLQNRASDLEALLGFLGIGDYDPIKLHNNMLRRTSQASTCLNERIHSIDLSGEERPEYDALWEISIAEIEELIREGELRRNYPRILAIVLRLRQWLDHPSLPAPFQKYARSAVEHPCMGCEGCGEAVSGDEIVGTDLCEHVYHVDCVLEIMIHTQASSVKCPACAASSPTSRFSKVRAVSRLCKHDRR
jgi:hypothetical protein